MNLKELEKIITTEGIRQYDPIYLELENKKAIPVGPMEFIELTKSTLKFKALQSAGNPFAANMNLEDLADYEILDLSKITVFKKI